MKRSARENSGKPHYQPAHLIAVILIILFSAGLLIFTLEILRHIDERFAELNLSGSLRFRCLLLYISSKEETGVDSNAQLKDVNRIVEQLRMTFPEAVAKTDAARQAFETELASKSPVTLATTLRFREAADNLMSDIERSALRFTRQTFYVLCAGTLVLMGALLVALRYWTAFSSAQKALQTSKERFAGFMEKGPASCFIKNDEGAYVYLNQQLAGQFGTRKEDWIGRTDLDLFPEEMGQTLRENDLAVLNSGTASVLTEVVPGSDGSLMYWLSYKFRLQDEAGRFSLGGMSLNVTEQKQIETKLGVTEARYHDLIESASDLIQSVRPDGQFLFANRAWRETLGFSESDLSGLSFFNIVAEDHRDECREMFYKIFSGESGLQIETVFVTSDGREITVEGTSDCEMEGGRAVSVRSIFRDVTTRKQAEAERERLVEELRTTIASVKELGGLLPICASCKRIRDEDDRWHRLETFISAHSRAEFSHGLCPDCAEKLFPRSN
jgi:PAS domain S-box-containing protein